MDGADCDILTRQIDGMGKSLGRFHAAGVERSTLFGFVMSMNTK